MTGFATALNEITLVLFTTLAPSGAVAYVIMGKQDNIDKFIRG